VSHCGACPDLPCDRLLAFQGDGRPHHRDVVQQARAVRGLGAERWGEAQRRRWACRCGAPYSWYETTCIHCGSPLFSYGSDPRTEERSRHTAEDAMPRRLDAVVFDFDFTLADASHGIVDCINHALQGMGLGAEPASSILPTIGLSLRDTLIALKGDAQAGRFAEFHDLFVERADVVMTRSTRLYPATPGTLRALSARGVKIGICTNKYRYRVVEVLEREDLLNAVQLVVGCEDMAELKPHPEGLWRSLDGLQAPLCASLYVGDSATDAEAAQRAGIPFVAVRSDLTPADSLARFPLLATLEDVAALLPWLEERRWLERGEGF
jgi:phosphoglycolate phosphatase